MPALVLHLTAAREAAAHPEAPPELVADAPALLLGAILPDLPYHARFGRQVLRHLTHREYIDSEWGDVMHTRATGTLALALLQHPERAQLGAGQTRRVQALAAGYLCHYALDTVVHPVINAQVAGLRDASALPAQALHSDVERLQSLFYHYDQLGYDIAGTSYARRLIGQLPGIRLWQPRLPQPLWAAWRAAMLQAHGRCPSAAEVQDWLWGVSAYGWLIASPLGRASEGLKGDLEQLRRQRYCGPQVDLATPVAAGIERTLAVWRAAAELLAADRIGEESCRAFLSRVPDVDLALGG